MKLALKTIKKFDSYGKGVTLNINGKESINSFCGGFFSLIYNIFFLIIFIINFYEFAFTPSPILTVSETFRPPSDVETLTEENFMLSNFFFYLSIPSPPTPINVWPKFSNATNANIKIESGRVDLSVNGFGNFSDCSTNSIYTNNTKFKEIYTKVRSLSKEKFLTCFNFGKDKNFKVGGNEITADQSNRIDISVEYDLCKFLNKTEKCNLTDEDFNLLSQIKLMTITKNSYVDKDQVDGFSEMFQTVFNEIDFKYNLMTKIKVRRVNISTDNNWLYNLVPNKDTETFIYSYETISLPRIAGIFNSAFYLSYKVELDNYTTVVERSYLKLDGMLANLGSIVVMIEFLSKFFADFFSEGNMEHSIYKEVFHIKKRNLVGIDPKIFSGIHKFRYDINFSKDRNRYNNSAQKKEEIELEDLNKKILEEENKAKGNDEKKNININKKVEYPNASIIGADTSRILKEEKHLKNELNDNSSEKSLKDSKEKKIQTAKDEKVYIEFKKILKEKTIKKSILVRFYQIFMPCSIKKNKNLKLLINLQDFISEELDIVKIIKKLIEYEHFKGLFLTENQIKIFNLMQKRILSEEILEEDASDYYVDFYFKNKMKELKSFKHLVDQLSNVDEENQYSKPILETLIRNFKL